MRKRVLMVATVPSMIGQFNMSNLKMLLDMGFEVDVAADFTDNSVWPTERIQEFRAQMKEMGIECIQLGFSRSALKLNHHLQSYFEIRKLIKERNYFFIHTHTPIASTIVRLAAHKTATKVIYTAHGFHFYNGAPLKNWLFFYPIEKWLSRFTDILITINQEDYRRAVKKFHAKNTVYIPGIGVDTQKFLPDHTGRTRIRAELELKDSDILILSVGELNENKNHSSVIRAIKGMNLTYVIVGKGQKREELKQIAQKCGVELRLPGYRTDITDFYHSADLYILPSIREGLNVSLMEAMSCGLPVACTDIRGNTDLIKEKGCLFKASDIKSIRRAIEIALRNREELGKSNRNRIHEFDIYTVNCLMSEAYQKLVEERNP